MEKRAGRYRAHLLLLSTERAPLHKMLQHLIPQLGKTRESRQVRWSLDVDPAEMI